MSLTEHNRGALLRAVFIAVVMLAASFLLASASPAYISVDCGRRTMGVMLGALVVMYANSAPKGRSRLAAFCNEAALQNIRRFTGWTLVLGGLGYMGAWLFAPIAQAASLALTVLGVAFSLVVLRCVRALLPH